MIRRALLLLCLLVLPAWAHSAGLTALSAADVPKLLKPPARGERIIMLWALDCAYCEANMHSLARLQHAHPRAIELITVATDSFGLRGEIEVRLRAAGIAAYPAFAYAENSPERLNYLIDSAWGGETPRTLVIRPDGTRTGISGELTPHSCVEFCPDQIR